MHTTTSMTEGVVIGVNGSIVSIEVGDGPIIKNEVAYVCPSPLPLSPGERGVGVRGDRLKAEVLRVYGRRADLQVFEETLGVRVGDAVELSGRLLSATLGPGILGTVYDGLQNPLEVLAARDGYFLRRGHAVPQLDLIHKWSFTPTCRAGDRLQAGDAIGVVQERRITHKIMLPFDQRGNVEVTWIQGGNFTADEPVARIRDATGRTRSITMAQQWPVRRSLPELLLRHRIVERCYPTEPLLTTIRLIDTFFPIALGGTACIPGPFGAGKTVLQSLIARYSSVDVVIVVACGERAGEVVETITEFSQMPDPRGGGALMDRTVIVCNTSSMPVAAREASIYTGVTIGEYYRQMGHRVLLLADSTSRWAQAMRETSGRLEEIPGEEAYPAYLDSAIKGIYERAGVLRTNDGSTGSLTMIGTVSPAGGNFEEPVTQSTLGTVKAFLGLSYDRAYRRFYPAVDPLISWSRYLEQLRPHLESRVYSGWTDLVKRFLNLLHEGDRVAQMMQVTGEEGISLEDFVRHEKAKFLDMIYLQQDAFDPVDVSTSLERQKETLLLIRRLMEHDMYFDDKEQVRNYFTRLTGLFKNLNYSERGSQEYGHFQAQIEQLQPER